LGQEPLSIGAGQLALGLLFILAAGLTSLYHALKLERDLAVGTVRTFIQLLALGYALHFLFRLEHAWSVLTVFAFMIVFAAWTIRGRVTERGITFFWPTLLSMMVTYTLVSFTVTALVVGAKPWWKPHYFIPLGGMVIGNSMNAIAIALDRLFDDLRLRRPELEMKLCLGATYREATEESVGRAMRAGMIPSINSMMAVGVVFIPGMMTGQILAGVDPLLAVRYQIVVMVMIVGATAVGSLLVVLLARRRCFSAAHQLLLRPKK
jgi:putative ABC transport system permease protein